MTTTDDVLIPGQSARAELTFFDRVHDRDDPDGVLVVVDVTDTRASAYELTDGITVADVHREYPRSDAVIACVYERLLDTHKHGWRQRDTHLIDWLEDADIPVQYYPETKLELYRAGNFTDRGYDTFCEHCEASLVTSTAWVRHVVRECPRC